MQYQKTIPLNEGSIAMIRNGTMIIQKGQWVKLAWSNTPSRYVGVTKAGSLWMIHTYINKKGKRVMDGGNYRYLAQCKSIGRLQ